MSNDISTTDGKHITPGTHEDIESNDEKAASGTVLHGPSYERQGTNEERALIFKQDLRIIPLCSVSVSHPITPASTNNEEQFIYLLCYLDRSNIGNAKVDHIISVNLWLYSFLLGFEPRRWQRSSYRDKHDEPPVHNCPYGLPHRVCFVRGS